MHNWRAEGTEFAVQEFSVNGDGNVSFRIETPDGNPAIVEATALKVIDGTIPPSWVLKHSPEFQSYDLGPRRWQEPGFWELWMDKDPAARACYQEFRSTLDD